MKSDVSKILGILSLVVLNACGNHDSASNSGQVIAKVNNEEISYHQLNFLLSRTPGLNQDNVLNAKKNIAHTLVDQSLLYQKAMEEKLDADPKIMLALEQAKREILAESWLQKTANNYPKPTAQDIDQYYYDHPELFAKHKTFKLKELIIKDSADKEVLIDKFLVDDKFIDDLVKNLENNKIAFQTKNSVQGAETLPLEQLNKISRLTQGQYISTKKDGSYWIVSVLAFSEENIEKNKAQPYIEVFLSNQRKKALAEKALNNLREKAKIEYIGDFASIMSDKSLSPVNEIEADKPKTEKNDSNKAIQQGIKGL